MITTPLDQEHFIIMFVAIFRRRTISFAGEVGQGQWDGGVGVGVVVTATPWTLTVSHENLFPKRPFADHSVVIIAYENSFGYQQTPGLQ